MTSSVKMLSDWMFWLFVDMLDLINPGGSRTTVDMLGPDKMPIDNHQKGPDRRFANSSDKSEVRKRFAALFEQKNFQFFCLADVLTPETGISRSGQQFPLVGVGCNR